MSHSEESEAEADDGGTAPRLVLSELLWRVWAERRARCASEIFNFILRGACFIFTLAATQPRLTCVEVRLLLPK